MNFVYEVRDALYKTGKIACNQQMLRSVGVTCYYNLTQQHCKLGTLRNYYSQWYI
jgi:hypothetical protein